MIKTKRGIRGIFLLPQWDLEWADGIAFGTPTRYGNMTAQMKEFIDGTGKFLLFETEIVECRKITLIFVNQKLGF
ncbi:MAG: NAD(P)H-dependent oxidoreductase [Candidatus Methanoperedens sp.]